MHDRADQTTGVADLRGQGGIRMGFPVRVYQKKKACWIHLKPPADSKRASSICRDSCSRPVKRDR